MKKYISTATINELLEDKKKSFNLCMKKGEYEEAHDLREQAIGLIQLLSMSVTYYDPIKYHNFYEVKMDGLEKSTDMLMWELDHLR